MTQHSDRLVLVFCTVAVFGSTELAAEGWSVVPYAGLSQMQDQTPNLQGLEGIASGRSEVSLNTGFTSGISGRYHYRDSRWISEFGWEYRSNDSVITAADGTRLPDGNYASNVFYVNGRYQLGAFNALSPWLGAGLIWTQEVDLDSEGDSGERSFSDSGSMGFQLMAGADYDLSDRLYLTGEIRYSSQSGIELTEEGAGSATINGIDYEPITLSVGVGVRF